MSGQQFKVTFYMRIANVDENREIIHPIITLKSTLPFVPHKGMGFQPDDEYFDYGQTVSFVEWNATGTQLEIHLNDCTQTKLTDALNAGWTEL